MCRRVRSVLCGIAAVMMVGACTLTTDLDGYAGPAVSVTQDAGDVVIAPDADMTIPDAAPVEASASDAYRTLVLSDSPVGYWRLDDTGDIAKDEVGLHDGMYMKSVEHVGGVLGSGGASIARDGYITIGDVFGFTANAPFTIEAWTSPTAGDGGAACIVAKDVPNDGGSVQDGWAFYLGNSNEIIGARWNSGTTEVASGPAVSTGVYSYVVMTYDGQTITLFTNGEMKGQVASKLSVNAISESLIIGGSRDGTSCYFHGVLDEVAIYDKALTSDRIVAHYRAVNP